MVETHLHFALECILSKTEQSKLLHVLYTILKELVINGCKANQKRIFFDEQGLDLSDSSDYQKGTHGYRTIFSEQMSREYGIKAKMREVYVLIRFNYTDDGMTVEVINNTCIVEQEEKMLRQKLKRAMGYNDIAEFYTDNVNMEKSEGAGLGMALVLILLKSVEIDPKYFRVIIQDNCTIARLEIPFTNKFISKRDVL